MDTGEDCKYWGDCWKANSKKSMSELYYCDDCIKAGKHLFKKEEA